MVKNNSNYQIFSLEDNEIDKEANKAKPKHSDKRQSGKPSQFRNYVNSEKLPFEVQSSKNERRLCWKVDVQSLDYQYLLPICMEGLEDKDEFYQALAYDAIMDMLEQTMSDTRVTKLLPSLIKPLKNALNTRNRKIVTRVLKIMQQLVVCPGSGEAMIPYFRVLLPICNILKDSHLGISDRSTTEFIEETIEIMEMYGGLEALQEIQRFVPSYSSCVPQN